MPAKARKDSSSLLLLSTQGREYSDEELLLLRQFRQVAGQIMANPFITIASATKLIGLSERTLYRKCKELTGLTPATYLRLLRLDRARELLLSGEAATVAEAAFAVGFEDTDYFARVFYRHYGQRASELLRPATT
ncbi:AraC family transcriptional regulator [Hymenobacter sp. BT18]|uniref:helix-turn-helix domain-containing protein n=1 Tax=Hymenobacter sp. BT18 TaxID=2835648 RepID=UPI00143EA042|nr:helix-turn-helix domain-containing protein [Hymenobacter sp. BT18]QIX61587.1 AraC family transcriptional regulator [Hymenobacter sp. BT18]